MSNITIGFSASTGIVGKVIRWFTRGRVSHAYATYYSETLQDVFVIEANFWGYNLTPHEKWIKKNKVVAEFTCERDLAPGLRYVAKWLGATYDFWSAFGLAARRWFGKWYRNPLRDPKKLHCSEAVTMLLAKVGLAESLDPESATPEDLYSYCLNNKEFKRICG
jgi:hypothetical protein